GPGAGPFIPQGRPERPGLLPGHGRAPAAARTLTIRPRRVPVPPGARPVPPGARPLLAGARPVLAGFGRPARSGFACRGLTPGRRSGGAATRGRVPAATAGRRRGALGRYRGGPPCGTGVRGSAGPRSPQPCDITLLFTLVPVVAGPAAMVGRHPVT